MKQIVWTLVISLLLLLPSISFCQKQTSIELSTNLTDSLKIEIAHHEFLVTANVPKNQYYVSPKHSKTIVKLSEEVRFSYFSITTENKLRREYLLDNYIIEPGDSLVIKQVNGVLTFSGKGAAKNNALNNLHLTGKKWIAQYQDSMQVTPAKRPKASHDKLDSTYVSYYPEELEESISQAQNKQFKMLESLKEYKPRLSRFIYQLIVTDIISTTESDILYSSKFAQTNFSDEVSEDYQNVIRNKLKDITNKHRPFNFSTLDSKVLTYSGKYLHYITDKLAYDFGDPNVRYNEIKQQYRGLLRDRLLTVLYLKNFTKQKYLLDNLPDALMTVKTDYCLTILNGFYDVYSKGAKAYNFSLSDATGKIVKLSDLNGKVVLVDFWFTGCAPCRTLASHLKVISEELKGDKSIVFVSINVDKDRSTWLSSVESLQYTSEHSVDLNTGPQGTGHDLIKFYKLTGYPKLLVIDKEGRVFNANPEIPKDRKSEKALIQMLIKAKL